MSNSAEETVVKKDDGWLAAQILFGALGIVLVVGFILWRRKKLSVSSSGPADNG